MAKPAVWQRVCAAMGLSKETEIDLKSKEDLERFLQEVRDGKHDAVLVPYGRQEVADFIGHRLERRTHHSSGKCNMIHY